MRSTPHPARIPSSALRSGVRPLSATKNHWPNLRPLVYKGRASSMGGRQSLLPSLAGRWKSSTSKCQEAPGEGRELESRNPPTVANGATRLGYPVPESARGNPETGWRQKADVGSKRFSWMGFSAASLLGSQIWGFHRTLGGRSVRLRRFEIETNRSWRISGQRSRTTFRRGWTLLAIWGRDRMPRANALKVSM